MQVETRYRLLGIKITYLYSFILLVVLLSGCAGSGPSRSEMQKSLTGFTLPVQPQNDKALVYFVFRNDGATKGGLLLMQAAKDIGVTLSYTSTTAEKVDRSKNQAFILTNIFTLGLLKKALDDDELEKKEASIGTFKPGTYKVVKFAPGNYEFIRRVNAEVAASIPISKERNQYVRLKAGDITVISIWPSSFINRYGGYWQHDLYLQNINDPLQAKYFLSQFLKSDSPRKLQ